MPTDRGRFADGGLQEMSSCILSSISLAALGLMIVQVAQTLSSRAYVVVGHLITLLVWISSVAIMGLSLWRHLYLTRGEKATRSDAAVYAIVALVTACLALALGWLAASTLSFELADHGCSRGDSSAPTKASVPSLRVKSLAASDGPETPLALDRSRGFATRT